MAIERVEFDRAAIEEGEEAYHWYAKRSQRAADALMTELDAAVEAIRAQPTLFAFYMHGCRRYLLKRFPYAVVYRELPDMIQVVAVAHGKRRPGYWKRRV